MTATKRPRSAVGMGTHAARAQERGAADRPPAGGLTLPDTEEERLDGLLPLGISPLAKRGKGRPEGSRNRRTADVADYLVQRFGDPLIAAASIGGCSLRDAVRQLREIASDCGLKLGATVMDIARFQQDCRRDVLPYVHAKRAAEDGRGDPVLPIVGIGVFEAPKGGGVTFQGRSIEDVDYQEVSGAAAASSHDESSHGEPSD